jgi:DNA invertase Pin-like site-specific DNA recombinase
VIGYLAHANDVGLDDDGLDAAIQTACERSGWTVVEMVRDVDDGPTLARPGLRSALQRISEGQAQGMVVSDLEPLGRSILDLGALMAWFRDAHATPVRAGSRARHLDARGGTCRWDAHRVERMRSGADPKR